MSISRRSKLDALKSRIDDITSDLREFVDAEQERYDSRSGRWQESEKGEQMQDALEDVYKRQVVAGSPPCASVKGWMPDKQAPLRRGFFVSLPRCGL